MTTPSDPPPGKRLGRGMLTVGWILVLALLAVIFGAWEERQINPNQNLDTQVTGDAREVTLQANRYHHYVATGAINGEPVTFLLDTGATDVAVPADLARELGLKAGARGYAQTANGVVEIRSTVIDRLSLGPIQLYDVRASINPGMEGDEILLGMSALRQVELNQKGDKLTLRQSSAERG